MTAGLNPYPGNGWERLPNRLLDPDFDDGKDIQDEIDEQKIDERIEDGISYL
jgi:hypothetical protein